VSLVDWVTFALLGAVCVVVVAWSLRGPGGTGQKRDKNRTP
jgi:hypothetical protein